MAEDTASSALRTIAYLAAMESGIDWASLIEDRISNWAAAYFDTGQALCQTTPGRGAYKIWKTFANGDLTPGFAGLSGFAATGAGAPAKARIALLLACDVIGLMREAAATCFHQLVLGLGGWAQLARQRLWQAELAEDTDGDVTGLLAIRLLWWQALFTHYRDQIAANWNAASAAHAKPPQLTASQIVASVLQEAAELAAQCLLADALANPGQPPPRHDLHCKLHSALMCTPKSSAALWKASIPQSKRWALPGSSGFLWHIAALLRMWRTASACLAERKAAQSRTGCGR